MDISKEKLHQIIFWIAGFSLLSYSTIRAFKIPITVDEGTTFLVYVQGSIKDVFLNNPVNTNNHFLNTFLIKISTALLGDSEFSVRLPSLLGHLMYIVFSFKLLQAITDKTIVIICGIVLLHFNPYFYDFFGLARGYSLSWGLMMGSMYYLYRYILKGKNKFICWSFALAGLSVYTILIALNYFLALIIAFNFVFLKEYFTRQVEEKISFFIYFLKKNSAAFLVSVLLFILLAYPVSEVRKYNEFYGEQSSFYENSILSVVNQSLFGQKYFGIDFPHVLIGIAIFVYLSVLIYASRSFFIKKYNSISTGSLAFGILFTIACWSTIAQYFLLKTPYLADRTALIYFPIFSILPVFFFVFFEKRKWLQILLCVIPLMAYSYHFSQCANTLTVREWWFDTNNKDVLNYFLENEHLDRKVTLAISGVNSPSFHFYEKVWNIGDKVEMIRKDNLEKNELFDYYYIEEHWSPQISVEKYEIVKRFDSRALFRLKK